MTTSAQQTEPVIIGGATLYQGDALAVLATLPDNSVHCCVTSPPYFGLRDYGTAQWEGGDPACAHGVARWDGPKQTQGAQSGHASQADRLTRDRCPCGALRVDQQIGLEPTPEDYITKMVSVFREVRRILRDDGTCWINIGDSYNNNPSTSNIPRHLQGNGSQVFQIPGEHQVQAMRAAANKATPLIQSGIKKKDLIGIPWLLAFALRADGWYLRQDIIWAKPNPMPESVTDRCTKAHEYLFLLTKNARYWYDAEAVREPEKKTSGIINGAPLRGSHVKTQGGRMTERREYAEVKGANRRSVWSIASQPFSGAHFATMPKKLVEPCILAGCPEQCCPVCGKGWKQQIERTSEPDTTAKGSTFDGGKTGARDGGDRTQPGARFKTRTLGHRPSCQCAASHSIPGTVLDPFNGAATVGIVALEHGRQYLGIELNPEYVQLSANRLTDATRQGQLFKSAA